MLNDARNEVHRRKKAADALGRLMYACRDAARAGCDVNCFTVALNRAREGLLVNQYENEHVKTMQRLAAEVLEACGG